MPAVAIVAGIASIGAGAAAVAAGSAIVGGLMIAGGSLTVLGTVTGNRNLSRWGSILALAGGIGALATGAWQATASELANTAALPADASLAEVANVAGEAAAGEAFTLGSVGNTSTAGVGELANSAAQIDPSATFVGATDTGAALGEISGAATQSQTPSMVEALSKASAPSSAPTGFELPEGFGTAAPKPTGIMASIKDFGATVKEYSPIIKVGGDVLAGAAAGSAEQDKLDAQIKQLQEQRDRLNASVKGTNGAITVSQAGKNPNLLKKA